LIVEHWEDLLRLAGSLKLGTVLASGLIRTLQTKDRPTKLARALEELGRLVKTLYLLRYIDDEAYRRRILVQLNRGEGAGTSSPASCFTASAASCGSDIARVRRTSSAGSASW
jgi:TnpA family transposase